MSGAAAAEQIDADLIDDAETVITDEDETVIEDRGDSFKPDGEEKQALDPAALDEIAGEQDEDVAKPNGMIPKARFDEVNNAKKAAELREATLLAEINDLRKGVVKPDAPAAEPVAASPEIASLEDEYNDALMDGDKDKAREIRMQINGMIEDNAVRKIDQRNTQATESQSITVAALAVIETYPEFNDASEHANAEAIDDLVALRDRYIVNGMKPAEAITKAAEKVAKLFDLAPAGAKTAEAPAVDERTKASIKRGAAIASAQPNTSAVGVGSREDASKNNISDMSEEQFEALPEAEKRRMRGD